MKKGISLIALMATITIIIILVSTITVSGINTVNNAKKNSFGTELKILQEAIDTYKTNNNNEYPVLNVVVLDVSNLTASALNEFTNNSETIINNKITLYEINSELIGINDLNYGNLTRGENDIYVLSKESGKVYYAKGLKIGNKVYFSLTADINNSIKYNTQKITNISNKVIIFEPSEIGYTKNDITIKIKIPQEYLISFVKSDNVALTLKETTGGYNIYEGIVINNCSIVVDYREPINFKNIKATYNVTNIDKTPPQITIDSLNKITIYNSKGEKVTYMNILTKTDNLSGIKSIKYDTYKVEKDIGEYFENNGISLKDNTIIIPDGTKVITVFIQDNALNWTAVYINN